MQNLARRRFPNWIDWPPDLVVQEVPSGETAILRLRTHRACVINAGPVPAPPIPAQFSIKGSRRRAQQHHYRPGLNLVRTAWNRRSLMLFTNVARTLLKRVDDALPRARLLDFECERFPVRVDECIYIVIALRGAMQTECQCARFLGKVNLFRVEPVPLDIIAPKGRSCDRQMPFPEGDHLRKEAEHVAVSG